MLRLPDAADREALSDLSKQERVSICLLSDAAHSSVESVLLREVLQRVASRAAPRTLSLRLAAYTQVPTPGERFDVVVVTAAPADDELVPLAGSLSWEASFAAARMVVLVGGATTWFARCGLLDGQRVALHWQEQIDPAEPMERIILSPALIEHHGGLVTCCGGVAALDLAFYLARGIFGEEACATVHESLCVERVREPQERQRVALQARFGESVPKLSEAVALMEANIEEPLPADDIARLVGISRRQLERLFKRHLNAVPSRYYLDIRLQRARRLLRETSHSIIQVGLMCGFSSASHFSTAYSTVLGVTPREERQRKLAGGTFDTVASDAPGG